MNRRLDFDQRLFEPRAGRELSKIQLDRIREAEMAAFESLSAQI